MLCVWARFIHRNFVVNKSIYSSQFFEKWGVCFFHVWARAARGCLLAMHRKTVDGSGRKPLALCGKAKSQTSARYQYAKEENCMLEWFQCHNDVLMPASWCPHFTPAEDLKHDIFFKKQRPDKIAENMSEKMYVLNHSGGYSF